MIRTALLYLVVVGIMGLAVRHWFAALCGLVFLAVLTQHPSMPTRMMNIPGMNPWNAAFTVVVLFWLIMRKKDPPRLPSPRPVLILAGLYAALVVFASAVAIADGAMGRGIYQFRLGVQGMMQDGVINPLKYFMVGVMCFDGIRSRQRLKAALFTAVASGMCYAILMFKTMKLRVFTIDFQDARRMTDKLIGLFANDIGELLAFVIWAALILCIVLPAPWQKVAWLACVAAVIPPFLAVKSRAGYLAFCCVGFALGSLKWRRIFLLAPVGVILAMALAPGVRERVMMGVHVGGEQDWDTISAGRMKDLWPSATRQILQSPLFGAGRYAFVRTSAYDHVAERTSLVPMHPHNSYLEILLDAGIIGLAICLVCAGASMRASIVLLRRYGDPLIVATGALGLIALVSELSAGVAGSSFFLEQSSVPYVCVWGAVLALCRELPRRSAASVPSGGARVPPAPPQPVHAGFQHA